MAPRGVLWSWGSRLRSRLCVGAGTEKLLTRCTAGLVTEVHHAPGVYPGLGVKVNIKVMHWDWDREVADWV